MEKIVNIIESIAHEKGLKMSEAKEAVSTALIRTAQKVFGEEYEYAVNIDEKNKELNLFQKVLVVEDEDERLEEEGEKYIAISEAREADSEVETGDEITYQLSLDNMGRTAAAILYRELEYHIQRLLEQSIFEKYKEKIGELISAPVTRVDSDENTYLEYREVQAILPMKSRIKGEKFKPGDTVKAVIRRVYIDKKLGMQIEVSRTSPKFLERLLELQVPEIKDGHVIVHAAARIPGERAKIALSSVTPNVDPVGATVGTKGVRINAVSQELHGENIDCIEYSTIPEKFIARAMSPAIISAVRIEGEKAIVTLPGDQKSKAIGKSGINIRLASMLTGFEIELNELGGTTAAGSGESTETQPQSNPDALKALFGE
ncbi:MAG TPA: transcription termination/antitermination protein NusA [Campylobacteraceae bacterium]|nr:transcription termination/antitermination protein NusA [Campylobacteraceae bacterium]